MDSSLQPIYDRLQKSMIELLEEVKDQPDSVLNTPPENGGWSVLQVMYHMVLVEEYSMMYVKKKLSFGEEDIPNAGVKGYFRGIYLRNMFKIPFKVDAPEAVNESNMPSEIRFWEVLKKWKDSRAELGDFLDKAPKDLLKKELYKHPLVGKMTLKNMLYFFELHFKRHRRQLNKVLKQVKYVV